MSPAHEKTTAPSLDRRKFLGTLGAVGAVAVSGDLSFTTAGTLPPPPVVASVLPSAVSFEQAARVISILIADSHPLNKLLVEELDFFGKFHGQPHDPDLLTEVQDALAHDFAEVHDFMRRDLLAAFDTPEGKFVRDYVAMKAESEDIWESAVVRILEENIDRDSGFSRIDETLKFVRSGKVDMRHLLYKVEHEEGEGLRPGTFQRIKEEAKSQGEIFDQKREILRCRHGICMETEAEVNRNLSESFHLRSLVRGIRDSYKDAREIQKGFQDILSGVRKREALEALRNSVAQSYELAMKMPRQFSAGWIESPGLKIEERIERFRRYRQDQNQEEAQQQKDNLEEWAESFGNDMLYLLG